MKKGLLIILISNIFLSIFEMNNHPNNNEVLLSYSNNINAANSKLDGGTIAIIIFSGIVISSLVGLGLYCIILRKKK